MITTRYNGQAAHEMRLLALHLIANSFREDKEQIEPRCTCSEYWHYPLDHNAGCPVIDATLKKLPDCKHCHGTGKQIPPHPQLREG